MTKTRIETFDMGAETDVAYLMGNPLTPAEFRNVYDENIADGRIPVTWIGANNGRPDRRVQDSDITYVMDHGE